MNSPLVTPTALADFAMHRQREFSKQEARKPLNRRSGSSIAESVSSMVRTYAWANGIDADVLLAGGLGAHKRTSARTDQKRSGGKSLPISAELLDTILPFMLDPDAPTWLSHFGLICALARESTSRYDDLKTVDVRTTARMLLDHDGGASVVSGEHARPAAKQDGFDARFGGEAWFLNIGTADGTGKHRSSRQNKLVGSRNGLSAKLFMAFLDRVQADQGPTWLTESSPLFLTCNVQKRSQTGCWPPWRGFATHYRLDYSRTCDKGFFSEILTVLMLMTGKFDPFLMPVGQGCRLVTFHGIRGGAVTDGAAASGNTDRAGQLAAGHSSEEATRGYNHVSVAQRNAFSKSIALDASLAPPAPSDPMSWRNRQRATRAEVWLDNAKESQGVVGPGHYVLYIDEACGELRPGYMLTNVRHVSLVLAINSATCRVCDRQDLFRFDSSLIGAPRQFAVPIGAASRPTVRTSVAPPTAPTAAPTVAVRRTSRWRPHGGSPWFIYLAGSGHYRAATAIATKDDNRLLHLKFRCGKRLWGATRGPAKRVIAMIDMLVPIIDTKFDANVYLGSTIAKVFDDETFTGVVTSTDESLDGAPLFHTKYADGDAEDLDFDELCRFITRMGPAAPPPCLRTLESF